MAKTPVASLARISVRGVVQGVGFRPFVYQLARRHGLRGWVCNTSEDVAHRGRGRGQGHRGLPARPARRARRRWPISRASPLSAGPPAGYESFEIRQQHRRGGQVPARLAGHRHLPRLPEGDLRPRRPPLPLSLHQLHQLRPALHHHRRHPLRPPQHHHEAVPDVPGLPARVRRPARPPLPRPAQRLPGLRPAAGAAGRRRQDRQLR